MSRFTRSLAGLVLTLSLVLLQLAPLATVTKAQGSSGQAKGKHNVLDAAGIQRLKNSTGNRARVSISDATGGARFVGFGPGTKGDLMRSSRAGVHEKSAAFFREYGSIFGIRNAGADLGLSDQKDDPQGGKHLTFKQYYQGVPVFAGLLKTHFDGDGNMQAANGNIVPEIDLDPVPAKSPLEAGAIAVATLQADYQGKALTVRSSTLYVYRTGLAEGVDGDNHLAWEIEVGNGSDVREMVYVDAHSGKVIDRLPGIFDDLNRRAYDGQTLPSVPPSYPASPFWVEGQSFPTGNTEADNMIISSKETYDFYKNAFGRDSFNGNGATMDSIFNRGYSCPNASWNGTFISFCAGLTVDDVTAHEWSHAYTQYTHGLIYQWQPGALNESYSDIFGETVDQINDRDAVGNSATDPLRTGACSTYSPARKQMVINSPSSLAGTYAAVQPLQAGNGYGPALTATGISGDVALALDAANATGPLTTDGCTAITNPGAIAGRIALLDRGTCGLTIKTRNAQDAGAIAVIVVNNVAAGLPNISGTDPTITIPTAIITQAEGNSIKAALSQGNSVNVTLRSTPGSDGSTRWLLGEDSTNPQLLGALRDMYNPTCYGNPGKVSDTAYYVCGPGTSANDNGGVHTNSGVPNHAYALIVDGGTYNGQTISGIGLTKAAHIYFRAMTVYQHPTSDFADHADAVEQSASDLIGVNLNDLKTGQPSGEIITAADVAEVQKAMIAVEMRMPPAQCGFAPLLGKTPPADPACADGTARVTLYAEDFEGDTSAWAASAQAGSTHSGGFSNLPNWTVSDTLPDHRTGRGFFVANPTTTNAPCGSNSIGQAGVRSLTSPAIQIPATASGQRLRFDHWMASELGFDGGQLMVSVNGGPFSLVTVTPTNNFAYSGYNILMATAAQGNDNPRAGQQAFSGADGGSLQGSWGTSVVNLSTLAPAGSTVRLRWDFSNDSCGGSTLGWYVDNVKLTACVAPSATAVTVAAAAGQYSDQVTLKATVGPVQVYDQAISGSVQFKVNNVAVGAAVPVDANGVATTAYTINLPAPSAAIKAEFTSTNAAFQNSSGTGTLTIRREDAAAEPSSANPDAVRVAAAGGNSGAFALAFDISEVADGSAGDTTNISAATLTLAPVSGGSTLTYNVATFTGGGVGAARTASFALNGLPVNVYDVTLTINGNYYQGSGSTVLTVYDPSLGFVTGGGTILHNGVRANFGVNIKYLKNGNAQGSLLYIEHRPTGNVVLKSNSLGEMAIVGSEAVPTGKATLNGVGNHSFIARIIDNGEPGAADQFGLRVTNPNGVIVVDLTFNPIGLSGGNVTVPKQTGK